MTGNQSPATTATLFCPRCGYNLTGLAENRCPECGDAFDPATLRDRLAASAKRPLLIGRILVAPLLALILGGIAPPTIALFKGIEPVAVVLLIGGAGLLGWLGVRNSTSMSRDLATYRSLRRGTSVAPLDNRSFIIGCTIALFAVQVLLGSATFFGGCAVSVLISL